MEALPPEELRAIAQRLMELADESEAAPQDTTAGCRRRPATEYTPAYLRFAATRVYRLRRRRARYFDNSLFGEVAWDMLLDLFINAMDGKRVSTGSLCLAAEAPSATGLRWINILEEQGLVERAASASDARVTYVSLSATGMRQMKAYVANEYGISQNSSAFMLTK